LDDILATPITPRFAKGDESRCLQQIVPGCYVAFEDDTNTLSRAIMMMDQESKDSSSKDTHTTWKPTIWEDKKREDPTPKDPNRKDTLATPHKKKWTHIVSICRCPADSRIESTETLQLVVPRVPDSVAAEDEDAKSTVLTEDQLVAARDFLFLQGHSLNWRQDSSPSEEDEPVRLLITAPRNRRADALSVALCFLAFTFNCPAERFLRELQARKGCMPVWKNVLDAKGVAAISRAVAVSKI
jgi:hypothetical protein